MPNKIRFTDIFFPKRCAICDEALLPEEKGICKKCGKDIRYVGPNVCFVCGRPLDDERKEYCPECMGSSHVFKGGRFALPYTYISGSVYRFKYMNRPEYASFYADAICKANIDFIKAADPDALIPVPLHKKRLSRRGYNQSAVLAHEISLRTGIPVYEDFLKRVKNTVPQKKFNKRQRQLNVEKAFIVNKNSVKLTKVLVVDDIFTTGSTIDSLSFELKKAGVRDIFFITVTAAGT